MVAGCSDVNDVTKPERFEIKAPEGSPTVVIVLIDDIGFGGTRNGMATLYVDGS